MSGHAHTEEQLVELPAIALFAELGWTTVSASDVPDGGLPPAFEEPLYKQECSVLFEHVFESYPEGHSFRADVG
jgi:hypothetical protein